MWTRRGLAVLALAAALAAGDFAPAATPPAAQPHPLDPLRADELAQAVAILRRSVVS